MNCESSSPTSTPKQRNPLETLAILNNKIITCVEGEFCKNSPSHCIHPRCNDCRLSPNPSNKWFSLAHWKPIGKHKHHILEKEKCDAKRRKAIERQKAEKAKDPDRQARARAAERAERKTEREIIHSSKNSGRVNRDGDHILDGNICLDTKQQSNAENPVVHLHELDKVRQDSIRIGKLLGALVIRNKHGRGVVVIDERDIGKLLK